MSYTYTNSRRNQRKHRRRSVLLNQIENLETMDTIVEENIHEMNWNSYVDPRAETKFDRKVKRIYLPNWENQQNLFDDELLRSMFYWTPDHYNKQPNKTRRSRNRKSSSSNSFSNNENLQNYQFQVQSCQTTNFQAQEFPPQIQNSLQFENNEIPDSIKRFGPPPGLTKPKNINYFSDSASDSETKPILSDEELLKDRSAIFATDFSSDSNFSDSYISDTDLCSDSISGFKLNPTAQVFQPLFG